MKKIALILAMALGLSMSASARDTYARDASVLPEAAQVTLSKNFKAKVSVVKIEKTLGHVNEYDVVLTDGTEITFDRHGNWDNVETANTSSVPKALVPDAITQYVASAQPGTRVVGIDKERSGYDVELSNGLDLKFNRAGQFVRYD